MVWYLCRSLFRNTCLCQACAGAYFCASYFCKCWTRGSILLVVGSLLFIGRQSLVALNFTDKMEFMYSCLHPKVYHEKISFYSWIYERNMCSSAACSCFFWLKACSWFLAHVFSYDLVYTTGGPPDFIVVLLIICYHWNLIRLFRTVLTETYDLRESYQCAIFITTVWKEHILIYSWLWWDL